MVKATSYSVNAKEPVFADVNGDGQSDALVSLLAEGDGSFSEFTYLWLWDAKKRSPQQLRQPVTDDVRCGNVTTSIRVGKSELTVRFLDRRKFTGTCAEKPARTSTKQVVLRKGFLYQAKPQVSALTPCGPAPGSEGFTPNDLSGGVFQAAPDSDAPVIVRAEGVKLWNAATDQSGVPKGWVKAMYVPRSGSYDYADPPCGFIKTQY